MTKQAAIYESGLFRFAKQWKGIILIWKYVLTLLVANSSKVETVNSLNKYCIIILLLLSWELHVKAHNVIVVLTAT